MRDDTKSIKLRWDLNFDIVITFVSVATIWRKNFKNRVKIGEVMAHIAEKCNDF